MKNLNRIKFIMDIIIVVGLLISLILLSIIAVSLYNDNKEIENREPILELIEWLPNDEGEYFGPYELYTYYRMEEVFPDENDTTPHILEEVRHDTYYMIGPGDVGYIEIPIYAELYRYGDYKYVKFLFYEQIELVWVEVLISSHLYSIYGLSYTEWVLIHG